MYLYLYLHSFFVKVDSSLNYGKKISGNLHPSVVLLNGAVSKGWSVTQYNNIASISFIISVICIKPLTCCWSRRCPVVCVVFLPSCFVGLGVTHNGVMQRKKNSPCRTTFHPWTPRPINFHYLLSHFHFHFSINKTFL